MKFYSQIFSFTASFSALLGLSSSVSAQSILKSAANYSALASQAITVGGTGFTFTDGNVGLFPAATSNITGFPPGTVSGTTLAGTAAAIISTGGATQQAEADLLVAANGLAGMAMTANYSNVDMANLGALPPGVYKWNAAATLTGALVLDAQGQNNVAWVFQFGTGLTTAVNSSVTLINPGSNGGSDDGIFWNAASGAIVIGDNNTVLGNYIAYTSISFTGSTLLKGNGGVRFLALNAAVTFAGPGAINPVGGPGGNDWTGGLALSGSNVVPSSTVAPVFNSPSTSTGTIGTPLPVFDISATGLPTSYSATGLPPGLSLNSQTGALSGTPTVPGTYLVTISATNGAGTTTSTLTMVIAPSNYARIANFSARAMSGSGSDSLIVGFVVSGTGKSLLVRGVGPALAQFGVTSPLADPVLTLDGPAGQIAVNSGWETNGAGQSQAAQVAAADTWVGAFALPSGSADAAMVVSVGAGAYTASVLSPNGTSGVALEEIYDADASPNPVSRLVNVSARMNVSAGQGTLIAGVVIDGNIPQTVLIRGVGPGLAAFGVAGVLSDPQISLLSGSTQLASNAGWGTDANSAAQISASSAQVGAFPLATGSKDAALIVTLQPGAYTVVVTSVSNSTGVALVEIYDTQ